MFNHLDERNKTGSKLRIGSVRRSALEWWNSLTFSQQKDYEYRTFGDGEPWEDNRLTDADIETIYMSRN